MAGEMVHVAEVLEPRHDPLTDRGRIGLPGEDT